MADQGIGYYSVLLLGCILIHDRDQKVIDGYKIFPIRHWCIGMTSREFILKIRQFSFTKAHLCALQEILLLLLGNFGAIIISSSAVGIRAWMCFSPLFWWLHPVALIGFCTAARFSMSSDDTTLFLAKATLSTSWFLMVSRRVSYRGAIRLLLRLIIRS